MSVPSLRILMSFFEKINTDYLFVLIIMRTDFLLTQDLALQRIPIIILYKAMVQE